MTVTYREMQQAGFKGFFRLEFADYFHQQRTPDDLVNFVMGTQCQKI